MNKQTLIIIGLTVALFLAGQYILLDFWTDANQQTIIQSYQLGYETGLVDTVTTIYQRTEDCQTTTISVGNSSKQVFDLECLQSDSTNLP